MVNVLKMGEYGNDGERGFGWRESETKRLWGGESVAAAKDRGECAGA